jgi:hypothetical protein
MRRSSLAVLLGYATLSVLLFGRGVLLDPTGSVVGLGTGDQGVFMWSLEWWPHAITTLHDPLQTDLVLAPSGWNLAWTTVIPGPALVLWPITATLGPVVAFNLLALAAPPLAAQAAFLLCRELSGRVAPSILGGLVYGFTTFTASQMVNHVNVALSFPIPLVALAIIRHARGSTSDRRLVVTLGAALLACFSIFLETFLTLSLLAVAALAIAHVAVGRHATRALWRTTRLAIITYAGVIIVTLPYTLHAVLGGSDLSQRLRGDEYPLDLASVLTPTIVTGFHGFPAAGSLDRIVQGRNYTEQAGYIGPVLLAVLLVAPVALRRSRVALGTLALMAFTLLLAVGPVAYYEGTALANMPTAPALGLPLIRSVLLTRLCVYLWLGLAVLTTLLVARVPGVVGVAIATGLAFTLAPTLDGQVWTTSVTVPPFFDRGVWRGALRPNANVLLVPVSFQGNGMFWQARAGFGFRMTGGYVSAIPPNEVWRYPTYQALFGLPQPIEPARELRRLLIERKVDDVVVVDGQDPIWSGLMSGIGPGRRIGGVTVWHVPRWLTVSG